MKNTVSIKLNRDFRLIYKRGKSAVSPLIAIYARKNKLGVSRLGLTVSTKVGKAVVRNRVRRRLREAYRINEKRFNIGNDIVIVARVRASEASFRQIEKSLLKVSESLGLLSEERE